MPDQVEPDQVEPDQVERTHQTVLAGMGTPEELGKQIGRLRYDALLCFIRGLNQEIISQRNADKLRGRSQLAARLERVHMTLSLLDNDMLAVWDVCSRHMAVELEQNPPLIARTYR